jgi:hypothetical protein
MRRRFAICFLSFSSIGFACSCASTAGCPGLGTKTSPTFVGKVLSVTDLPRTTEFKFLSSRKARFQVDERFGGIAPEVREIDVLTGSGGGDCGIPFQPGAVYLIQASVDQDGALHAGICSATRGIESAGPALQVLRKSRDGQQLPSLTGTIARYQRDFDSRYAIHRLGPLAHTIVRLKAENAKTLEAITDAEGVYSFYGLPSGRFEFSADLPPGTTARTDTLTLRGGACQEHSIAVYPSGSIQGRILDASNQPLPHALVYIVPAEQSPPLEWNQLYWEGQYEEGHYKLVQLPAGKYVIVVNPEDTLDPSFPYPRTFYPGVHQRESAAIITLAEGEQLKGVDLRLEPKFQPRRLKVRIEWADGRLVKDALIDADGIDHPEAIARTSRPDPRAGLVELLLVPDVPYRIAAHLTCSYADERSVRRGAKLQTSDVFLEPKDDRTELTLTMPATACPAIAGKTSVNDQ